MSSPLLKQVGVIDYRGNLPLANALILGSGKTAAFLVPILSKLMGKAKKVSVLKCLSTTTLSFYSSPAQERPFESENANFVDSLRLPAHTSSGMQNLTQFVTAFVQSHLSWWSLPLESFQPKYSTRLVVSAIARCFDLVSVMAVLQPASKWMN